MTNRAAYPYLYNRPVKPVHPITRTAPIRKRPSFTFHFIIATAFATDGFDTFLSYLSKHSGDLSYQPLAAMIRRRGNTEETITFVTQLLNKDTRLSNLAMQCYKEHY